MKIDKAAVFNTIWDDYEGKTVRTIRVKDGTEYGTLLFALCDIQDNILGLKNASDLYRGVDPRSKAEVVLSFSEEYNPQRYKFVNIDGLTSMVYRARKCEVNRLDFLNWAEGK